MLKTVTTRRGHHTQLGSVDEFVYLLVGRETSNRAASRGDTSLGSGILCATNKRRHAMLGRPKPTAWPMLRPQPPLPIGPPPRCAIESRC